MLQTKIEAPHVRYRLYCCVFLCLCFERLPLKPIARLLVSKKPLESESTTDTCCTSCQSPCSPMLVVVVAAGLAMICQLSPTRWNFGVIKISISALQADLFAEVWGPSYHPTLLGSTKACLAECDLKATTSLQQICRKSDDSTMPTTGLYGEIEIS